MSFQFLLYGFGLTFVYYIGLFYFSKKRKAFQDNPTPESNTVDELIVDAILEPMPQSVDTIESVKTVATEISNNIDDIAHTAPTTEASNEINKTNEIEVLHSKQSTLVAPSETVQASINEQNQFPMAVFDTGTPADTQSEVPQNTSALNNQSSIEDKLNDSSMSNTSHIHEVESADFMLTAYESSIEKTHKVSMSQLLEVINQPVFDRQSKDGVPNMIDEKFINQVIEYTDNIHPMEDMDKNQAEHTALMATKS